MTNTFKNIKAWQCSHQFVLAVYKMTRKFPNFETFGLSSQFQRAAVSIPANIAEGYKRLSTKDKLHFFNISQGSLEECRYYIELSHDLEYISDAETNLLEDKINQASFLLNAYCKAISDSLKIKPKN